MLLAAALAALCAAACGAETPPASAPASRPAATQPGLEMQRLWRRYLIAWAGSDVGEQSAADQALVRAALEGPFADAAALRPLIAAEYERRAALSPRDEFACARLASRAAVAWTRDVPKGTVSPVGAAVYKANMCRQVVAWALRALAHLAADIPQPLRERYGPFVPGTAASMLSLVASRGPYVDDPDAAATKLQALRPSLEKLAPVDAAAAEEYGKQLAKLYESVAPFEEMGRTKRAVLDLVHRFRKAYNARDGAAMAALYPEGHPVRQNLAIQPLSDSINPRRWQITRWEVVFVQVQADKAMAWVVVGYTEKDGTAGEVTVDRYPARRTEDGWRLM